MPTLVAALTLAGLLKMTHVGLPAWHLAFWYAAIGTAALFQVLPLPQALLNGVGTFLAAWLYFALLDHTNNITDRVAHYFVLVLGMLALLGLRFWIDIQHYGIGL